jgi:AbrB family looped-hinge helix DNA binding protein
MYYLCLVNTVITSKGQITIPAGIRRRLHLRPGDRLSFDPDAPFVKAVKAFDVGKMKSTIGCCREKASQYSAQTWLDETRGPVESPPEAGNAHRG